MASLFPNEVQYQQAHIDEDKSPRIIAACVVCLVAAFLVVILRFVSRRLVRSPLQADDYTIIVSLVSESVFESALIPQRTTKLT